MLTIPIGFEVGPGKAIELPLAHTVVTGQTQLSGKTTALEAMVDRSGLRAIAFVTKRFEGAFTEGNRLQPYFRERTDWRFVASLLEATMSERMRRERPWIVKVSKGARTLADVHRNVESQLKKAKGYAADMYTMLDEYLKIAVADLGKIRFADRVELSAGLNVMDLSGLHLQTQSLVIASVLEWIYQHERDTVTIIPEAWEFLPLQRQSPVLLAAEQLIRKGAAGKNFVWLDSQDLAGVAAAVRKQIAVYLIGVQRESNEVKRMLDHISGVTKPSRDDIMALELGHFYACWRGHAHHVYVQPKWLDENTARKVAMGSEVPVPPKPKPQPKVEDAMPTASEIADELERRGLVSRSIGAGGAAGDNHAAGAPDKKSPEQRSDEEALIERVYQRVMDRIAQQNPAILKVSKEKPEIEVTIKRATIRQDGASLPGRIAVLVANGFFDDGATYTEAKEELHRTGRQVNFGNLSRELKKLKSLGFLTSDGDKYKAVEGMKVNIVED